MSEHQYQRIVGSGAKQPLYPPGGFRQTIAHTVPVAVVALPVAA